MLVSGQDTPAEFEKRVVDYLLLIEPEKGDLERIGPPNEIGDALLRILEKNRNARDRSEHPGMQLKAKSIKILGRLKERKAGPIIASILVRRGFHTDSNVDRSIRTGAALALIDIDPKEYKGALIQAYDETGPTEFALRRGIARGLINVVDPSDSAFIFRLELRGRGERTASHRAQMEEIVEMRRRVP